jgi:hypothetical protein
MRRFEQRVIRRVRPEANTTKDAVDTAMTALREGKASIDGTLDSIIGSYLGLLKRDGKYDPVSAAWIEQPSADPRDRIARLKILLENVHADVSIVHELEQAVQSRDLQPEPDEVRVTHTDVTERSQDDKRMDELQEQLQALLTSGYPIDRLADLLDARSCVEKIPNLDGRTYSRRFDVSAWLTEAAKRPPMRLPEKSSVVTDVILPPGDGEIKTGDGTGESSIEHDEIPRTRYLLELLQELDMPCLTIEGKNTEAMVREKSYVIFVLPDQRKLVMVNNEINNATYIVHGLERGDTAEALEWSKFTKQQLQEFNDTGKVDVIIWKSDGGEERWKQRVRAVITAADSSKSIADKSLERRAIVPPPEGWMLPSKLAMQLRRDVSTIERAMAKQRPLHPDWFGMYANQKGYASEYIHPELIHSIAEALTNEEPAPDGWQMVRRLPDVVGADRVAIENFAKSLLSEHPDWAKKYRGPDKQMVVYYHPDLVAAISAHYEHRAEPVPDGWQTNYSVAKGMKAGETYIQKMTQKHRANHPEWFKTFKKDGRNREFYSPELVAVIKLELEIQRS